MGIITSNFDMAVFDPAAGSCEIYAIKHSTEVVPQQYRGEDMVLENGITYRNVEDYLMQL